MSASLGEQLLATRAGTALLVVGVATGRLEDALGDPGTTLCLVGHAYREVDRGTDDGRLEQLRAAPPAWLRSAAAALDARDDLGWWSRDPLHGVQRQLEDGMTGLELVDHHGHPRSLAEEAEAHLHTFTSRDRLAPVRRWRADDDVTVHVLDGPEDWDALGRRLPADADGIHLTLRGALTIPEEVRGPSWPWEIGGTHWLWPVSGIPLADDDPVTCRHDHDWVELGRSFDPTFDEGDELVADPHDATP